MAFVQYVNRLSANCVTAGMGCWHVCAHAQLVRVHSKQVWGLASGRVTQVLVWSGRPSNYYWSCLLWLSWSLGVIN